MTDLVDGSIVATHVRAVTDAVGGGLVRAAERSRVLALAGRANATIERWLGGSRLHAWLTAEPEPAVIVVDLRETVTLGPVVAVVDGLVGRLGPRWHGSVPQRSLSRWGELVECALAESRTVGVFRVLLVPPEPPAGDDE